MRRDFTINSICIDKNGMYIDLLNGINDINKKFGFKTQQLCSYKLIFNFKNNNGILEYLNKKQIFLNYKK